MRSVISMMTAVAFLSTASIALASPPHPAENPPAPAPVSSTGAPAPATSQPLTTTQRVVKGGAGAGMIGGGLLISGWGALHLPAYNALYAIGLGPTAATCVIAGGFSVLVGGGIYLGTRAIVGNGPSPMVQAAPGLVSGATMLTFAGIGVHSMLAIAAAGGVIGGAVVASTVIVAAAGIGLLGYGIYRGYKAWKAAHAQPPQPATPPQAPVATGSGSNGTQPPATTPTGSGTNGSNGGNHHGIFIPLPSARASMGGSGVPRNANTQGGTIAIGNSPQTQNAGMHH